MRNYRIVITPAEHKAEIRKAISDYIKAQEKATKALAYLTQQGLAEIEAPENWNGWQGIDALQSYAGISASDACKLSDTVEMGKHWHDVIGYVI